MTDEGVDGYREVEATKTYLKPVLAIFEPYLLGQDPAQVEATLLKIRGFGGTKPWGGVVSAGESVGACGIGSGCTTR